MTTSEENDEGTEMPDPYRDGIRDALEEVRALVDELPDGPHVLELESKIDALESRMTGATEPNPEDSISIRIGRRAAQGLSDLLGSDLVRGAFNGIAGAMIMRQGEKWAASKPCRCTHGELLHPPPAADQPRGACTAKDCRCAGYVARLSAVKP